MATTPDDDDVEIPHAELSDAVRETENELLQDAFNDKPKGDDEAPAADEPEVADDGEPKEPPKEASDTRARDDKGRFVSKDDEPKPEAPAAGEERADDGGETVPRWRVREIAEERRQAQAERDQARAELARMQFERTRPQPAPQPPQPKQAPDPLLDPVAYNAYRDEQMNALRAEFQQQLTTQQLNFSLARAHDRHGETFEKAYDALIGQGQAGNTQLVQALTRAPDPGTAIVNWYRQQEVLAASGGNLDTFRKNVRDELLKDPEFIKEAIGIARQQANGGGAPQGGQQRPNTITRLPPSLARVTGSPANAEVEDTDDSDRSVFDYATRR